MAGQWDVHVTYGPFFYEGQIVAVLEPSSIRPFIVAFAAPNCDLLVTNGSFNTTSTLELHFSSLGTRSWSAQHLWRSAGFQTCCVADFQIGRLTFGTGAWRSNKSAIPNTIWYNTRVAPGRNVNLSPKHLHPSSFILVSPAK
jgi:hypothetical protein